MVEVDARLHQIRCRLGILLGDVPLLCLQTEVALGDQKGIALGEHSKDRQSRRLHRLGEEVSVPGGAHLIEDHTGYRHSWVEVAVAVEQGCQTVCHRPRRHHQHHRQAEQTSHLGGRTAIPVIAVEESHHALCHRHLSPGGISAVDLLHTILTVEEGVEIDRRTTGCCGVELWVEVVRAALEGLHPQSPPYKRPQESYGNYALPAA